MGILQDDSQGAAKVRLPDFIDIYTVITDFSVLDVIKAVNKVRDGRFSCARAADKGDLLPRRSKELDVVQDDFNLPI